MTDAQRALFYAIYQDLPKQGPGDDASTRRAFRLVADRLPAAPRVLDLGCGTGRQTMVLAGLTEGVIVAIDNHQPYLDRLEAHVQQGFPRAAVRAVQADLRDLPGGADAVRPGTFDLVWSEGALYVLGLKQALAMIHPLLQPDGALAFTELTWRTEDPPEAARALWRAAYPAMQTAPANRALVRAAGFEPIGDFVLPEAAWWDGYYRPIEERLRRLRARHGNDPHRLEVIEATQAEIDGYRAHADAYGYVFYTARKRPRA
jgi:serine/threonine-protein kinase HipA